MKLANWFEANLASRTAKVVMGFLLSLTAIASIVIVTGLSGF